MEAPKSYREEPHRQPEPGKPSRRTITQWLVAAGLAAFLVPLYLVFTGIQGQVAALEANLEPTQGDSAETATPAPHVQELVDTLAEVEKRIDLAESIQPTLASGHRDWPEAMAAIGSYDPARVALVSVSQSGSEITLQGKAIDDAALQAYAQSLEASGLFEEVSLQSIRAIATPFATPTSTPVPKPTPTATPQASPTPALDCRDSFEPDDYEPQDLYLGQAQSRTFCPADDVDRVRFLVKGGRHYRLFTSDLAPGVDTYLTVRVDDAGYANDDHKLGALASEVTFQAPADRDVHALAEIRNRGGYGPEMSYRITLQEVVATATVVPQPTPTATRAPTLGPTSDLRDAYEPDDANPRAIRVGETQTHNFYPAGDVDLCTFTARAGHSYRVYTADAAPGVDATLSVYVDGVRHAGSGRGTAGGGSEVTFRVEGDDDVTAIIIVRNLGQYGADRYYHLTVQDTASERSSASRGTARLPHLAGYARIAGAIEFVIFLVLRATTP